MSTLTEVEAAVPQLSVKELIQLEQFVRQTRLVKIQQTGSSALELPPLDLGRMLTPLGDREAWHEEMREAE